MAVTVNFTKGLIGREDFNLSRTGGATFSRATSTGGSQSITKLRIAHLLDNVYNVMEPRYGAAGDWVSAASPGTNDQAAIQNAINDAADNGGGIVWIPGKHRIDTGLSLVDSNGDPAEHVILCGSGNVAGFSATSAPGGLYSDQAITMLTWGVSATTSQKGPIIQNLGFRDYSNSGAGGTVLVGIKFIQGNWWILDNVAIAGLRTGAAIELDGGADYTQYGQINTPKVSNCKYGIHVKGSVTDITMVGGQFLGRNPSVSPTGAWGADGAGSLIDDSIGIWFDGTNNSALGRWSVVGTGVNDFETGLYLDGARYGTFNGLTVECVSAAAGNGIGIRVAVGDGTATDQGDGNHINGGVVTNYGTGVQFDANTNRNSLSGMTFNNVTTNVTDTSGYNSVSVADGESQAVGMLYSYGRNGAGQKVGFTFRNMSGAAAEQPILQVPESRGLVLTDGSYKYGLYLGATDDSSEAECIVGAGLTGDADAPTVEIADTSGIRFIGDEIWFCNRTGLTAGDAFSLATALKWKLNAAGALENTNGPTISAGSGTPESSVTAPVGSIYFRTDGGASTSFYVKESGAGNTGWVAK